MLRIFNWITFLIGVALICLGMWTAIRIDNSCHTSHLVTEAHVNLEEAAQALHKGSEFLTLEARQYVLTHSASHLQKYLSEMFKTRTRENSLSILYGEKNKKFPGSEVLAAALERSDILARKELYAMRLVAEATGVDLKEFPELVQNARLTSADSSLDTNAKLARARELLFNDAYTLDQFQIMEAIHHFMTICGEEARRRLAKHMQIMTRLTDELMLILIFLLVCISLRMGMFFGVKVLTRNKRCARLNSIEKLKSY